MGRQMMLFWSLLGHIEKLCNFACDLGASKSRLDAAKGRPRAATWSSRVPPGGRKAGAQARWFSDIWRLSENYHNLMIQAAFWTDC